MVRFRHVVTRTPGRRHSDAARLIYQERLTMIPAPEKRTHQLVAMFSDAEEAHVRAEAAAVGATKASYIRMLVHADMRKLAAK